MVEFDSAEIYINSATNLRTKLARIDALIDVMYTTATKAATSGNITEYSLDDGQTKIRTVYTSASQVFNDIKNLETLRELYLNKLNGRVVRLVDRKNFRGRQNGR
jgi:hypothetical protein